MVASTPADTVSPVTDIAQFVSDLTASDIRYAISSYVDLHGRPKAKMVPIAHLESMIGGSELYTGLALDGVPQAINDDEVASVPDLSRWQRCPWNRDLAWFPCTLHLHEQPFEACSRAILERVMAGYAELGLTPMLGTEAEFFVLKADANGQPVPVSSADTLDKPCYDLATLLDNLDWVDELVTAMNGLGWDVYSFDHEDANGQFEIDFGYTDAVSMSDRHVFLRLMLRELLKPRGLFASWMPKPFVDRTGSGGHLNMSLRDANGDNAFVSTDDPRGCGLSELGYHFIAGILAHAPAVCCAVAPTVNSYKRLVKQGSMSGATWAPVLACYGDNNRTNMLRIPMGGGRVECRAADSATNPYLAAAMIFAAGLEGIRGKLNPGSPNRESMYEKSAAEVSAAGISHLPESLGEAVEAFVSDDLAKATFGPAMHKAFVDYKREEWNSYRYHVSQWELDRYLTFL